MHQRIAHALTDTLFDSEWGRVKCKLLLHRTSSHEVGSFSVFGAGKAMYADRAVTLNPNQLVENLPAENLVKLVQYPTRVMRMY
jgi:hypothetical protein